MMIKINDVAESLFEKYTIPAEENKNILNESMTDDSLVDCDSLSDEEEKINIVCDEEPLTEEKLDEDKLVDIEDFLTPDNYIHESVLKESLNGCSNTLELPDRPQKGRPGSPEYSSNNSRKAREKRYRKFANLDESFVITEENINDWALTRTCTFENCSKDKLRAELLRQPYTGLEKYYED